MTIKVENVSKRIFDVLKGRGFSLKMYTTDGKPTLDPVHEARRFFVKDIAMMVTIHGSGLKTEINVYKSAVVEYNDIKGLIKALKDVVSYYGLSINIRQINKRLSPKDFRYLTYTERKKQMSESSYKIYGSKKTSYQRIGKPVRVIIKHKKDIDENLRGARSRSIKCIFIEYNDGERRKFPTNWLMAARAMGNHLRNGGEWDDHVGKFILDLVKEYTNLGKLKRRLLSDFELKHIVDDRMKDIRKIMQRIQKNYKKFSAEFVPVLYNEDRIGYIRELFDGISLDGIDLKYLTNINTSKLCSVEFNEECLILKLNNLV